jgi:hypothetical protein
MVYNTQDYWDFGLCPSSHILENMKNSAFRKLDLYLSSDEGYKTPEDGNTSGLRSIVLFYAF